VNTFINLSARKVHCFCKRNAVLYIQAIILLHALLAGDRLNDMTSFRCETQIIVLKPAACPVRKSSSLLVSMLPVQDSELLLT